MEWIIEWLKAFLGWLYEILLYIPQKLFELFLQAILEIIKAVPLPDFITNYSISDYIHPDVLFFLHMSGVDVALALVGSAYIFYFFRRVLTLGIW